MPYALPNAILAVFLDGWGRYYDDGLFSGCCWGVLALGKAWGILQIYPTQMENAFTAKP